MDINLVRRWFSSKSTIGELSIAAENFHCFTLEDVVRPDGVKIPGETAIPEGTYKVTLEPSPKFNNEIRPRLHDVPNFVGILIHVGNEPKDTEGCILVGRSRPTDRSDFIGESKLAFSDLQQILERAAKRDEPISISVTS